MTETPEDRTYFRSEHGVWHATRPGKYLVGVCGVVLYTHSLWAEADRLPSTGRICKRCSRSVMARTDIEP